MTGNTLHEALFAPLAGRNDALIELPDGATISGRAFAGMIARFAHALTQAGVQPGDRVVVQLEKSPAALAVYAAAVTAGAVFVPLNTAYTPDEVDYFIENAEPRLVLVDPALAPVLGPLAERHGARVLALGADGGGSLGAAARGQPEHFDPVTREPDDLAALLYTSGTTGRSKGAMLSHANLLSNAQVLVEEWRFSDADVLLHVLPIFHTHGLFVATNVTLAAGARMILLPKFDIEAVIAHLPRATVMMGVPTHYTRLLADDRVDRDLVGHMRLFVSGSAPLLEETHEAFAARTGHRILERYGMTETNMNTSNPYDGERRAGTVGFPLPGVEVRITDPDTGEVLDPGATGIVEVRGLNVFMGYWRMPEKTAEELRDNGFFITGDLGRVDADGYLHIVGRSKDMIISGGLNVYPKEIELILDAQPGVAESAVIGVPHPDFGEAVLGVLVPRDDAAPDLAAIRATLGESLAAFKRPKALVTVPELPRNTMGKVQKAELRARFGDRFAVSGG